MEICYISARFPRQRLSLAAQISAGGKALSARGSRKSAGGNTLCPQAGEVLRRQKDQGCYSICATDSFPIGSVTSEPTWLHDAFHIH
jgi:hypothetical protein